MNYTPRILAFAGSTRTGSYNKLLVRAAAEGARAAGAEVTLLDLRDLPLPLYDGDDEAAGGLPENARRLKALMKEHDGLLIASPEYNSSISAVLKNALDWASRPEPGEAPLAAFAGKTALLLSASPGALGGLRGLVTLRSLLSNIQVLVLPQQLAVGRAQEAFDEDGVPKDPQQAASIGRMGATLAEFLTRLHG